MSTEKTLLDARQKMLTGLDLFREGIEQFFIGVLAEAMDQPTVAMTGRGGPFAYPWPAGRETYPKFTTWSVDGGRGAIEVRVCRTRREAWARNRKRFVVFGPARAGSASLYPWVEFTETDDRMMAAVVPDPARPRRQLRDGGALPPRYQDLNVQRTDAVFGHVQDGASLRLVVAADDEEAMVRHAYYVAELKGRI